MVTLTKINTVYQLNFLPTVFSINCYLVEEETDLTWIDTGMAFCFKGIIKQARAIGKPITRIILTHPLADHVGALDQLKETLPHATVYLSKRDNPLMTGAVNSS